MNKRQEIRYQIRLKSGYVLDSQIRGLFPYVLGFCRSQNNPFRIFIGNFCIVQSKDW